MVGKSLFQKWICVPKGLTTYNLTGLETGLGIADVGFTYSACVLVGDCYIGQPHPDLPEMLVIGQDVIVTSSDVVLPLLGLGGGGPAGQALTDAITTMFSGAYDANRIWNDAPTHMAIGVTGDINFENNVLTVDADHKFILIYP